MRFLFAAAFIIQTAAFGQSVAVSIGSASGMPGSTVTVPITLTSSGGAQSVDVEWAFSYSSDITAVTVTAGNSSTNAQKTVACNNTTCLIYGLNTNVISDGTVATATFQIAASPSTNPIPIQVTGVVVSSAGGSGITASGGSGSITLSQTVSLAGLTCTTANLNTPASTPCTATLTGPAPAGGFTVPLSVNNTSVTIPASLQIQAGQASGAFTATAAQVTTNQTAVITAGNSAPKFTFTLNLAATAAQLTSLTCSPASIPSGGSGTCTVSLNGAANGPAGAATAISLNAQAPLTVPQSVMIAPGQSSTIFPFTSGTTQAAQNATITASLNNQTQTATISIGGPAPVQITGLTCAPASINSSATAICTVTVATAPTTGSVTVATSASTSAVTVPATVQISLAQTSAAFTATAAAVNSDASSIITASVGNSSQTFTLNVIAPAQLNQVVCTPTTLSSNTSSQCTVSLTKTTNSSATISLSSSNAVVTVPTTVTVSPGQSSATFIAAAGTVSLSQTANITATYNGQTQQASIQLSPASQLISMTCSPMTVNAPGSSNCNVTLSQPAGKSGVIVNLTSGNANVSLPATITVLAGSVSGSFVATVGQITQDQTALLGATANGGSASVTLSAVVPTVLSSVSCAPSSLGSNATSTCTVSLNKPAASAAQISLSSNNTALTVPASVAISAGLASATFVATTGTLQSSASASVTATWSGSTVSTSISLVQATQVTSLTCSPATVNAPGTSTCTVTVPAWPGAGASVLLSSNNSNVTVPGLVSFATGQNTATFTATVAAVTANGSATIVAALNGGSQSAVLNFTAPAQLTSLVCVPSTLSSNSSSNCVVALNRSAASAMTVGLSSNRTSLTVPASVTIAAGATTASFSASTSTITVNDQATVTATLGSQSLMPTAVVAGASQTTATVALVVGVQISGVTCTLASLNSNQSTTCLATLTATSSAPVTVALASNTTLLSVPASVVVAAGQTHNSFTVTAGVISTAANATITASVNNTSAGTQIALIAGSGSSTLTCAPAVVMAPGSAKCTLTVPAAAPSSSPTSTVVPISSDNPAVTVPSSVTIPSGASNVTFTATVATVSAASTANLTAMVGGSPVKAALTINVGDSLTKLACSSSRLSANATTSCSVTLASPAQGAFGISLTSSNPSGLTLTSSISASLGQSSVSFQVIGNIVSQTQNITIIATAGGSTVQTIVTLSAGNPPTLSLPAELDIKTLTLAQFTVTSQDSYKLPVTLSATGLPPGAAFSAASGVFQWTPSSTQTGNYKVTISGADSAGLSSSYLVTIKVSAAKSATTGIFNIASLALDNTCSPGSLATLMGSNFTATNPSPTGRPAASATSMAGVEVKVNGTAVPLLAVTGQQINFQCPVLPPGTALNITVETKSGSSVDPIQATMAESTPGIFMVNAANQGAVLIAGTNELAMPVTDAIPSRPAKIGEYLTIFASGLGPVAENIPAGAAAPLDHVVAAMDQVSVVIGGAEFTPSFAGLAPGQTGLYQVNVGLAEDTAIGNSIPLYVRVTHPDGTTSTSNTVTIAIQGAGR